MKHALLASVPVGIFTLLHSYQPLKENVYTKLLTNLKTVFFCEIIYIIYSRVKIILHFEKKFIVFPVPSLDVPVLTKLSLFGNY